MRQSSRASTGRLHNQAKGPRIASSKISILVPSPAEDSSNAVMEAPSTLIRVSMTRYVAWSVASEIDSSFTMNGFTPRLWWNVVPSFGHSGSNRRIVEFPTTNSS